MSYIIVAIIFIFNIVSVAGSYAQIEKGFIENVEVELAVLFDSAGDLEELAVGLDKIILSYPMELIIFSEKEVLYQTIPLGISDVRDSINEDVSLLQTQKSFTLLGKSVSVWYNLYHVQMQEYIASLTIKQFSLIGISIIIVLTLSFITQYLLFRPLSRLSENIAKIERYQLQELIDAEGLDEDEINRRLRSFARSLDSNIKVITRTYTELEQALQLERERLANTITVSKAFIHDLKSPLHQLMLENEQVLRNYPELPEMTKKILEHNTSKNEETIYTINDILLLMDENIFDLNKVKIDLDIIELLQKAIVLFKPSLKKNAVSVNLEGPEKARVTANISTMKLLIHNIISNAIQYATEDSEIEIYVHMDDGILELIVANEASAKNIARMKASGNIFRQQDEYENQIGSGNGLLLIQELAIALGGQAQLEILEEFVSVKTSIPLVEGAGSNDIKN
ncbi:hypothetical protein AwErysi_08210 [Erysipelotrichaceae bacterium]|nr:hypothetical protein AwErysi_08210 [Erysipelotrichaceae bacterium]